MTSPQEEHPWPLSTRLDLLFPLWSPLPRSLLGQPAAWHFPKTASVLGQSWGAWRSSQAGRAKLLEASAGLLRPHRCRGSAPVGWHRHPCWDSVPGPSHHHLLCLSTAQGPSLRQETIAFPSASLGKPPRQPAEQISGASHAGTEPPPRRAAPERLGFAAWRPTCPWPGANPLQRQASCVSCAHGVACRRSRGAGDQGTLAGRAASPALGRHRAGPASGMERWHGGFHAR